MPRAEKTVFISYRRKDISWALAVYQNLTAFGYDVFFDYTSIHSGDFERIILSNIKARAHFLVILTPTALDRCSDPRDWLRREIETAISEKRNIIPIFFDNFNFGDPSISKKLTGELRALNKYNGLEIPAGYFGEAMERLRKQYLDITLDAVLHPISNDVLKVVKEQQIAANRAVSSKKGIAPARKLPLSALIIGGISVLILLIFIFGGNYIYQNLISPKEPTTTTTKISPIDGMTMAYIPAGEFEMGSIFGNRDERPIHTVYLDPFWIDQTEVTNEIFVKFIIDTSYETDAQRAGSSGVYQGPGLWPQVDGADWQHPSGPDSNISDVMDHPVVHMSWNDAKAYCEWAGRRLPTEAEWEKAARGGLEGKAYPWGDDTPVCEKGAENGAQYVNCGGRTVPVGSFGENGYGLYDMAGNVWECVEDWYDWDFYANSPSRNPKVYISGDYRARRGGSWDNTIYYLRSSYRNWDPPTDSYDTTGFRCAMDASE